MHLCARMEIHVRMITVILKLDVLSTTIQRLATMTTLALKEMCAFQVVADRVLVSWIVTMEINVPTTHVIPSSAACTPTTMYPHSPVMTAHQARQRSVFAALASRCVSVVGWVVQTNNQVALGCF